MNIRIPPPHSLCLPSLAQRLTLREQKTRITTKYSLAPPSSKSRKRKRQTATTTTDQPASTESDTTPVATLTLKTYDTDSGACLQFKTDQAAEANRLVRSLGALGQGMAGLEVDVDAVLAAGTVQVAPAEMVVGGGDGGEKVGDGGKKKKKKGKK